MDALPPGIAHILRTLPQVTFPFAVSYAIVAGASQYFDSYHPFWAHASAVLALQPVYHFVKISLTGYQMRRKARSIGTIIPPSVESSSISVLMKLREDFENGYPGDPIVDWSEKYGNTWILEVFGVRQLFTTEPEHIKAILASQFREFGKGSRLIESWRDFLGVGVFNSDGDIWKVHRGMTRPFFSRDRISDFDIFDRNAMNAISQIKTRLSEGHAVDLQDATARFTLDSSSEFLFGVNIDSLSAGIIYPDDSPMANSDHFVNHPSTQFVNAFTDSLQTLAKRVNNRDNWPLFEFWKNEAKAGREVIDEVLRPLLEAAFLKKQEKDRKSEENDEEMSLLASLVEYTQDRQVIMDEIINILIAGRDTTSGTISFCIYVLSQRPDIRKRLRDEIFEKVGRQNRPTYDDIKEMKYLRAFLNEVLRLYPVVPFNSRAAYQDATLPNNSTGRPPYFVPKDTTVAYSVFVMHRRKDLWGPDAEIFDPDRFIDERLKIVTKNPFIFLPFNAGPRICLGQQFAYNEMSFFLIRFLQTFSDIELAEDVQPKDTLQPESWKSCPGTKGTDKLRFAISLTLSLKGGLWVRLKWDDANENM